MKNIFLFVLILLLVAPVAHAQNSLLPSQSFKERAYLETMTDKGKGWYAMASYPIFRANDSLVRYANWQLRTDTQAQLRAGTKQLTGYLADNPPPKTPYEYMLTPRLSFAGRTQSQSSKRFTTTWAARIPAQ